jgi:hypothetical protein
MAFGISWVSYRLPKTTTIGPTFIGTSETISEFSFSGEQGSSFTFPGATFAGATGYTTNLSFSSYSDSNTGNRNNVPTLQTPTKTFFGEDQVEGGATRYTSKTENSTITYESNLRGQFSGPRSGVSSSRPLQTVTQTTLTSSSQTATVRTTTTRSIQTSFATTTMAGTIATITFSTKSIEAPISTRATSTFTGSTTTGLSQSTSTFKTFTFPTGDQLVVYDTVWVRIPVFSNSNIQFAVAAQNSENVTEPVGVNLLGFISASVTTLSWVPPLSFEETWVSAAATRTRPGMGMDTWETFTSSTTFNGSRSTFSQKTVSRTALDGTESTYSVEDWDTFTTVSTTSNSSTTGTKTILSASLDTGYTEIAYDDDDFDEDGNQIFTRTVTIVPHTTSVQTQTSIRTETRRISTTQTLQSSSRNDDLTTTTTTLSCIVFETYSTGSFTGGFHINQNAVPWTTRAGFQTSEYLSLKPDSSYYESTTFTTRYKLTLEKTDSSTETGTYATAGTGKNDSTGTWGGGEFWGTTEVSTLISGVWFRTQSVPFSNQLPANVPLQSAFATHSPAFFYPRATAANLSFNTSPNLTAAPFLFTMEGNEHVIDRDYRESDLGEIRPGFLVPLVYPSFTTVLSSASSGGRLHPSVWSTMTVSREGDKFSSSWQFEKSKDENGTTFTTASGSCQAGTDWDFPLGVETRDSRTLGGAMQPNSNLVFFQTPGVVALTTYDKEGFGTQFSTESEFTFSTITPAGISVRSTIPVLVGYGLTQYPLLDNGLP